MTEPCGYFPSDFPAFLASIHLSYSSASPAQTT